MLPNLWKNKHSGKTCLPCNELLCSSGTQLYQGSLLLCSQIHRLLRVEVRPQRGLIVLQFVLPWFQRALKCLWAKSHIHHGKLFLWKFPLLNFPCNNYYTLSRTLSYPVSGEHLSSVLVLDLNDSRRLDPGLAIHLNGNPLITQDGNFHCSTLIHRREAFIRCTYWFLCVVLS